MKNPPATHSALLSIWSSGQTQLPRVVRWLPFHERQGTRRQDTLQHTYSLAIFTSVFLERVRPFLAHLDEGLIMQAILLHDHGEGELGRDVLHPNKTGNQDLAEYEAFRKRFQPVKEFRSLHEAYLLQYSLGDHHHFPDEAQIILRRLAKRKLSEARAFSAIEAFDYLLYAVEQYVELGNKDILAHVLGNVGPRLDNMARLVLGFAEGFWTHEFKDWCAEAAKGGNPALP